MTAPKMYSMWTPEGKALGSLASKGEDIGMGKMINTFSTPRLKRVEGGRIIECGIDGRGCWLYAEWPSEKEAREYTEKAWGNPLHENW